MRTRALLAGAALGAALVTGGTAVATAQAVPVSTVTGPAAVAPIAQTWIYVGTYRYHQDCYNDGVNSAYADWECRPTSSGKYQLWVDNAS
ncbi:hypothetical protein ACIGEZ_22590 [Streptomyces sp. NPDC085481]|uniref:hypothetical protein n=1 Tax=Streptomyces sp. NPDC085481 TaxID=3365727 RepID=UPI0037D51C70